MRSLPLFALAVLFLIGCGSDTPATDAPPTSASDEPAPSVEATVPAPSDGAASPADAGPYAQPGVSAGTYTLRYAVEEDGAEPQMTEVSGVLPAPVTPDIATSIELSEAPNFRASIAEGSLPEDFDLNRSAFLFFRHTPEMVQQDGETTRTVWASSEVRVLDAGSDNRGHRIQHSDPMNGSVTALAFPPLWTAEAAQPTLALETLEDETELGSTPLPVFTEQPAWVHRIEGLPVASAGADIRIGADLQLADRRMVAVLVYKRPGRRYSAHALRVDTAEERRRTRAGESGTPMHDDSIRLDPAQPEVYLVVIAP